MRLVGISLSLVFCAAGVVLQTAEAKAEAGSRHQSLMRISYETQLPVHRKVTVGFKKSMIVEVPRDLKDVVVSDPKVVDALVQTANRIYLIGKDIGTANAFFFDQDGERIMTLEISVERDPRPLEAVLDKLIDGANIKVQVLNDTFILTGQVRNAADASRAAKLARRFAQVDGKTDGLAEEKVVNMLSVAGSEQVMLKVVISELKRDAIKRLGMNGLNAFTQNGKGLFTSSELQFPLTGNTASNNYALGATCNLAGDEDTVTQLLPTQTLADIQSLDVIPQAIGANNFDCVSRSLEAFERHGLGRILAEPNLTAVSGETATFNSGGEFPVQSVEDGEVKVEYKDFGVSLGFTPVVVSDGLISLKISTIVSEIDATLSTAFGQGLSKREANTSVELPSGGSMAIAGLISDTTRQNIDRTPGLGRIPVLGTLFRSRDFQSSETELVIIVTPYLVKPTHRRHLDRADKNFMPASDLKASFLGQLNRIYGEKAEIAAGSTKDVGWIVE
ncbi:MAG: type II and III secretion system protein family protein [Pseudomonadota bacterium]